MKHIHLLFAVLLASLGIASGTGKIATVAQVAANADGKTHVFLLIDGVDGAKLGAEYALFHKAGPPASTEPYTRIGTFLETQNVNTIAAQLALAEQAGFDNAALESALDQMLDPTTAPLAEKLLIALVSELPNGLGTVRREMLSRTFPQTALPLGRGFIAAVPSGTNTFEVREPNAQAVIGRATVTGDPSVLPAVGTLGERVDPAPTGDLSVALRWCTPDALRLRALHIAGYHLYRVSVAQWTAEVGGNVPLDMSRELLLAGLASGVVQRVNRTIIGPEIDLDCPLDPTMPEFFFIDVNDTKDLQRNEGGSPFVNGEEVVYFTTAMSHVGVIGHPSPGLPVTVCDRLPPSPPRDLRVENLHTFDGAVSDDYLEVSWQAQAQENVAFYCIHRYRIADGALKDRASGNWPHNANLVAIVPNAGVDSFGRLYFPDNGTVVPPAPIPIPYPNLGSHANQTFWYTVCAIDQSACQDADGYGNVGAPTGSEPAALYRSDGPERATGRVRIPCCELLVDRPTTDPGGADLVVTLTGIRNSQRIVRVEFALEDIIQNVTTSLGEMTFPLGAGNEVSMDVELAELVPTDFRLLARFATDTGSLSEWSRSNIQPSPTSAPDHTWNARWECSMKSASGCDGVPDPVDPETGDYLDICVDINPPPARAVEIAIYTRVDGGPMIRRHRNDYDGPFEFCFSAPASPGRVCLYTQTFDKDGNPGVVAPLECLETLGHEGFPIPTLTQCQFLPVPIGDSNGLASLAWSSPTSGVHRFEIRVSPPIPGETRIVHEQLEAGVITRSWSHHETPSLFGGFGQGGSDFVWPLSLTIGTKHAVEVRAIGIGPVDERLVGPWSASKELFWSPDSSGGEPPQDGVSWPIRPVPGDDPTERLAIYSPAEEDIGSNQTDRYVWVEVGQIDPELVIVESLNGTSQPVPAFLSIEALEPYLTIELPFVGYLRRTDVAGKPMLQTTHFIDEILTEPSGNNLTVIDDSFRIVHKKSLDKVSIWLRLVQPLRAGGSYEPIILQHHPDRELRSVFRTNAVQIP